ncbi:hypothetical protein [Pseudacidovorax intermedius]|uniref:Uncharacterized protein n=1 Tax=Pseudacidovorax intermedius TaxID=433924 RepID=A0A147H1T2_9BURK|nr:hypothetical protein [Pseudacidovorax intermedius]KTT23884.1 hypothetical protein NS331_06775 [Pseudacidovorax intermedius]
MQTLEVDASQVSQLITANHDFSFAAGTEVTVVGTGFLTAAGANAGATAELLAAADVTVAFGGGIAPWLSGGPGATDAGFDQLISQLQSAGMDRLGLTDDEVLALASQGYTLNEGAAVTVSGVDDLLAANAAQQQSALNFLGHADVTAKFSNNDVTQVLAGSDAALDALVAQLQSIGVDHLALDASHVTQLAQSGNFSLLPGVDVTVSGTGFLSATGVAAGGAADQNLGTLLGAADVTVHLTPQNLSQVLSDGDASLDTLVHHLLSVGVDHLALDADQVGALASANFSFDLGTPIVVEGIDFVQAGATAPTAAQLSTLLGEADVTVRLSEQELGQVVHSANGDAALDALVAQLQAVGMDHLGLSAGQVAELAHSGSFSFEPGVDVTVAGTGFLSATGLVAGAEADQHLSHLLGAADVTVQLGVQDVQRLLKSGDAAMDALVQHLQGVGMDRLSLDIGQVGALAHADFTFAAGTAVVVDNFDFAPATSNSPTPAQVSALLGEADVTIRLSELAVTQVVQSGDAALDALVAQLQGMGMDHLELNAGQVVELAHANFSFDAGASITVTGTGFLHAGGVTEQQLHHLLDAADVTVQMSDQDLGELFKSANAVAAIDDMTQHLHDAGVDALSLGVDQALALADAGAASGKLGNAALDMNGLEVKLDDALALAQHATGAELQALDRLLGAADTTALVDIADVRATQPGTAADLANELAAMQQKLDAAGVDHIQIDDALANALADAGVQLDDRQDLVLKAQADGSGHTAYLEASLQELQKLGVDEVKVEAGVEKIVVAMHGGQPQGTAAPAFTLADLPQFQVAGNTKVELAVTEDDLARLFNATDAFGQLAQHGITDLQVSGNVSSSMLQQTETAAQGAHIAVEVAPLTPTEVQLLGLGTQAADPMDPFHTKHS